jgi:hypothetical protein
MSNTKKFTGPIKVGQQSTDPTDTEVGTVYFNTTDNVLKIKNSTQYKAVLGSISDDVTPALGGDLDVLNNNIISSTSEVLLAGQSSVRRATQGSPTDFIEEQYIHSISLLASQTGTVISELTFDPLVFETIHITYKMRDAIGSIRTGTIMVVSDGTLLSIFDGPSIQTNPVNISFNAQVTGPNIEITYTSSTEAALLRVDVKKIKA